MRDPSRVRVTGPLQQYAPGFVVELARLGYKPKAAAFQVQLMAHLSRWMDDRRLGPMALTPEVAEAFLAARRAGGYVMWLSPKAGAANPRAGEFTAMSVPPAGVKEATGDSANAARQPVRRFAEHSGRRRVTASMLTHRMAGGHMPVATARSASGSPQMPGRGPAKRASHLTSRTESHMTQRDGRSDGGATRGCAWRREGLLAFPPGGGVRAVRGGHQRPPCRSQYRPQPDMRADPPDITLSDMPRGGGSAAVVAAARR